MDAEFRLQKGKKHEQFLKNDAHHNRNFKLTYQYLKDPQNLALRTKVNGQLRQDSNTSQLVFKIPQIIQFCSQGSTLAAGSVILTGTPSGVGYAMKPPQWLQPGDKVEITIEKIGTLVNRVVFA